MKHLPVTDFPTWNPADLQMPGPRSSINRSTGRMLSFDGTPVGNLPLLDCHHVSSLYSAAVLVHGALQWTRGNVRATFKSERHATVNFENLSCKWQIGLETAKRTLEVTTLRSVTTAVHPLHRRNRVDQLHLNRR
jgi:hypothetical protein